jgi:hypothetical protein
MNAVSIDVASSVAPCLFEAALGEQWWQLPVEVRQFHSAPSGQVFSGTAEVIRGCGLIARIAACVVGFPRSASVLPISVTLTRTGKGETWERNFGGCILRSYCMPARDPLRYRERFSFLSFEQDLLVEDGRMHFPVRRGWVLGVPLPRFLLPRSKSTEYADDGMFHFDIELSGPLGSGLIVRYRGALQHAHQSP